MARRTFSGLLPLLSLILVPSSQAQPDLRRPAFEVVSIKLGANCASGRFPGGTSPGRLDLSCISLRTLIRMAYGQFSGNDFNARHIDVLGGPDWLDKDKFDLSARAEGNPPGAQMMGPMLQTVLEERFKVKVHKEPGDMPVYALTVAKNNPRLQHSAAGSCTPSDVTSFFRNGVAPGEVRPKRCGWGEMRANGLTWIADWYGVTMDEFAVRMVSNYVDRPVVDRTGLTGSFDVHLEFARDVAMQGWNRLNGIETLDVPTSSADTPGPSIFTALQQQLGLKLSRGKSSLEVIVVDYAEKPSEN